MGEIHKFTKNDKTIYPATITDAVIHPQIRSSISDLITEYNITKLFPNSGSENSNKYTLQGAISLLSSKLTSSQRIPGIKIIFTDFFKQETQEWRYLGGTFTITSNWSREDSWYSDFKQDVSDIETSLINNTLLKTKQDLTGSEKSQVKENLDLNLSAFKIIWDNDSNANQFTNTGTYIITGYRTNPEDNLPLINYGVYVQFSGTLISNNIENLRIISQTFTYIDNIEKTTKVFNRSYNSDGWSSWVEQINKLNLGLISINDLDTITQPGIYTGLLKNPENINSDMDVVLASSYEGITQFKIIQTVNTENKLKCSQIIYLQTNLDTDLTEDNRTRETIMIRSGKRTNINDYFVFSNFTTFITKTHLDDLLGNNINPKLLKINNSINNLQDKIDEIIFKSSDDYCVAAWDNNSLAPTCIETYGSLDFCDKWDFYLIDTTENIGDSIKPVGKLKKNNIFRFDDNSWAPVVGIKEERRAECDVALYTSPDNGITLDLYCDAGKFDSVEFYNTYGMNTKLYNSNGDSVNILRPWETTETKYTICLGRDDTIYLLDNVLGNSGKRWKGIFSKPIVWDGIDISKYKLDSTGISPGPATVIKEDGIDKLRNFFYLYEGNSCCAGYKGVTGCELFRYDRTWPVSYDYLGDDGYRISQVNNMIWARNNNYDTSSPIPFAEGGFLALNSFLTSYEVFYGTKYLHSQSMFTGNISSINNTTETAWKINGNLRIKELIIDGLEQDLNLSNWSYKSWGNYIQESGYYYKIDASDNNITWSSAINNNLPKEQCMESQIVASYISELDISENTEFDFYGNTYWYRNIPGTTNIKDGKMNIIIYKLIKGTINVYKYNIDKTTIIPVTLKVEIILPIGLMNGANLNGDCFMFWGGGYELVGTKNTENNTGNGEGGSLVNIYIEPNQSNWNYETNIQKSNFETFKFEDEYLFLSEQLNLEEEGYSKERLPYTGFSLNKGGTMSTGECAYHWSGNYWENSSTKLGQRTRLCVCFRNPSFNSSVGSRSSYSMNKASFSNSYISASIQIKLKHPQLKYYE